MESDKTLYYVKSRVYTLSFIKKVCSLSQCAKETMGKKRCGYTPYCYLCLITPPLFIFQISIIYSIVLQKDFTHYD